MADQLPGTLYAQFELDAIYTDPDGTVTTGIKVRVHRHDAHHVERDTRAEGEMQTGDVMVMAADIPKPVKGGRFTVETVEVWTVKMTPALKNGEHICRCARSGVSGLATRRDTDA